MTMRTVKCPNCGNFRKTSSLGGVKCFFCGKTFEARKHIVSSSEYIKKVKKDVDFK